MGGKKSIIANVAKATKTRSSKHGSELKKATRCVSGVALYVSRASRNVIVCCLKRTCCIGSYGNVS